MALIQSDVSSDTIFAMNAIKRNRKNKLIHCDCILTPKSNLEGVLMNHP